MIADHRANHVGQSGQRSDVEARLPRDRAIDLAPALDHDDLRVERGDNIAQMMKISPR